MIRSINTALLILALILQPFAVATAAPMADRGMAVVETPANAPSDANMDERQQNMDMTDGDQTPPCEQKISQDSSEISCDDCCGMDCELLSRCATSCAFSPFVTVQYTSILVNPREQQLLAPSTTAHLHGRASLIFHPPKHS